MQAIESAFDKFKASNDLNEFKEIPFGFGDLIEQFKIELNTNENLDDVETLKKSFIESGSCIERLLRKNPKECSSSKVKVVETIFGCFPNVLGEFLAENCNENLRKFTEYFMAIQHIREEL